LQKQGLFYFAL